MGSGYGIVQISGTNPASQVVRGDGSGNGPGYCITNQSPITRVFLCDSPSPDLFSFSNVSVLSPLSYVAVDGKSDVYAVTMPGGAALVSVTPGASSASTPTFQYAKKTLFLASPVFGTQQIAGIAGQTIIIYSINGYLSALSAQAFFFTDTNDPTGVRAFAISVTINGNVATSFDYTPNGIVLPVGTGLTTSNSSAGFSGSVQYLQGVV